MAVGAALCGRPGSQYQRWTHIGWFILVVFCSCSSDSTVTGGDESELDAQDRGRRPVDAGSSDWFNEHSAEVVILDASLDGDLLETVDSSADNEPDLVDDSTDDGFVSEGDSFAEEEGECALSSPAAPTSVEVVAPDFLCDDCGYLNWDPVECATYYMVDFTCWLSTYSTDVGNITSAENCRDSLMDEGEGCYSPGVSSAAVRACNANGCSPATEANGWELLWCSENACLPCG